MTRKPSLLTAPRRASLLVAVLAALALAGCISKHPLGRATGRVTFRGEPVIAGEITFHDFTQGVFITMPLDEKGRYTMETAEGYGLPPGTYQVSIGPPHKRQSLLGPRSKTIYRNIPPLYRDPKTSGFTAEVRAGDNADFDFDMK